MWKDKPNLQPERGIPFIALPRHDIAQSWVNLPEPFDLTLGDRYLFKVEFDRFIPGTGLRVIINDNFTMKYILEPWIKEIVFGENYHDAIFTPKMVRIALQYDDWAKNRYALSFGGEVLVVMRSRLSTVCG